MNSNYDGTNAFDFYDESSIIPVINANDESGHGTHIAGIIGAEGDNESGIAGINWNISLVQLRALDDDSQETAIYNAIMYAVNTWNTDKRIPIINFSIGLYTPMPLWEEAIRAYTSLGGLFVCSTGNLPQNNDIEGQHHYPSFYASELYKNPIPNMITVGRSTVNDECANRGNWGNQTIMLYAPGENILSTFPYDICYSDFSVPPIFYNEATDFSKSCEDTLNGIYYESHLPVHFENGYHYLSGSSMATPHVTGVAALLLSIDPSLTASQIKEAILNSVDIPNIDGNNPLENLCVTEGRLNAFSALKYLFDNFLEANAPSENNTVVENVNYHSDYYLYRNHMTKWNINSSSLYNITVYTSIATKLTVYDSELNVICDTEFDNIKSANNTVTVNLLSGIYYLRVQCLDEYSGNIGVQLFQHQHNYTEWKYFSPTMHKEKCACGAVGTKTNPHVLKKSEIIEGMYDCVLCGHRIPYEDGGFGQIIMNIQKVTLNGSYILPNGIIVLVDEDIEAYFNGTLVFYDKDDLPQIQ